MKTNNKSYFPIIIVLFIAFCLLFVLRFFMSIVSDDELFMHYLEKQTLFQYIHHVYTTGTGKIFTDPMGAILTAIPFPIWKVMDCCVWIAFAIVLTLIVQPTLDVRTLVIAFALLLCYPVRYLESAGYIVTSTNYVYPSFCIAVCILILLRSEKRLKPSFVTILCSIMVAAYAASQEQAAVVLIALIIGTAAWMYWKGKQPSTMILATELVTAFVIFALVLMSPGHIQRAAAVEGRFCVPGFADWSYRTKIYKGFTTTAANILFCPSYFYYLFIFLLFLGSLQKKLPLFRKLLTALPCVESLIIYVLGSSRFVFYPSYGYMMPDLQTMWRENETVLFPILAILIIASICVAIVASQTTANRRFILLYLAGVAFGSRAMMGFSATLFGSSFRTFTYLLLLLVPANLLLFKELNTGDRKLFSIAGTVLLMFCILSYAQAVQFLTSS